MKRLSLFAVGAAAAIAAGAFLLIRTSGEGTARDGEVKAADSAPVVIVAQADTEGTGDAGSDGGDTPESDDTATKQTSEGSEMSDEDKAAENGSDAEADAFKQRVHEGDVALGVCGARVSALLWFYEASVAQGREDLKPAVDSLKQSCEVIKAEAERRAKEDRVDTTVRVMNDHSEELWNDLNKKAEGDPEEFQKSHDQLVTDVQECLNLFFDRPDAEAGAAEEDGTKTDGN